MPRYVEIQVYRAVLELAASEQSARMVAMRNATDAAQEHDPGADAAAQQGAPGADHQGAAGHHGRRRGHALGQAESIARGNDVMRQWLARAIFRTCSSGRWWTTSLQLLKKTCEEMKLGRDEEWILEVIRESRAEPAGHRSSKGRRATTLAEYILGLSAARNALVVASYCFRFLKGQKLIDGGQGGLRGRPPGGARRGAGDGH